MLDEPIEIERLGRRKRKHMMMSVELIHVVNELADEDPDRSASELVTDAVWAQLVEDHGRDRVLELVDDVQEELEGDDRLETPATIRVST